MPSGLIKSVFDYFGTIYSGTYLQYEQEQRCCRYLSFYPPVPEVGEVIIYIVHHIFRTYLLFCSEHIMILMYKKIINLI